MPSFPLANNYQPSVSANFGGMANNPASGVSVSAFKVISGSATATLDYLDSTVLVDSLFSVLVTLPNLTGIPEDGKKYTILNTNTGLVTVTGTLGQLFNRSVSKTIATGGAGVGVDFYGTKSPALWVTA